MSPTARESPAARGRQLAHRPMSSDGQELPECTLQGAWTNHEEEAPPAVGIPAGPDRSVPIGSTRQRRSGTRPSVAGGAGTVALNMGSRK